MTGLVLAGGRSSRFGSDKSRAVVHGGAQDMTAFSLNLFAAVSEVDVLAVSCRKEQTEALRDSGALLIPDEENGAPTPLRGIVAALKRTGDAVFILPCDLPLMRPDVLAALPRARALRLADEAASGNALLRTCFLHEDGRMEPLVAIYEAESLPFLEEALHAGRWGIHAALPAWGNCLVPCPDETAFLNMNTPQERERAVNLLAACRGRDA